VTEDDEKDSVVVSLDAAASHLLDECRMVLPGIQALFGFQLIAVFSSGFDTKLSSGEQRVHLASIVLVAIAIALVMAPAALHRQVDARVVTARFLTLSSRLLAWSMPALAGGIALEVYLVARGILGVRAWAAAVAGVIAVVFVVMWFWLPRTYGRLIGDSPTR